MLRWLAPVGASALAVLGASSHQSASRCEAPTPAATGAMPPLALKQVQVVFRHGARAPLTSQYWEGHKFDCCGGEPELIPLRLRDPSGAAAPSSAWDVKQQATKLPGGCSRGQLTSLGHQQAIDYGRWLRQRYVDTLLFLPASLEEGVLAGRSTNFARTIATLRGVLTGLYPGPWPFALPAVTSADVDEILYANVRSCERLGQLVAAQVAALRALEQDDDLTCAVRRVLSLPDDARVNYTDLHDALTTIAAHGKQIPDGLTPGMVAGINKQATKHMLHVVSPGPEVGKRAQDMLRLGMGVLLETITGNMRQAGAGPRLYLYSGHDTTIMPLLVALGADVDSWPPYLSNLVFELWEAAPQGPSAAPKQYVRVYYNKDLLKLPGSTPEGLCELTTFVERVVGAYAIHTERRAHECTLEFVHDDPEPHAVDAATGSAVQGI